jgi:hypothetical protein
LKFKIVINRLNFLTLFSNQSRTASNAVIAKTNRKAVAVCVNAMVFLNTNKQILIIIRCLFLKKVISKFYTETKYAFSTAEFNMLSKMAIKITSQQFLVIRMDFCILLLGLEAMQEIFTNKLKAVRRKESS